MDHPCRVLLYVLFQSILCIADAGYFSAVARLEKLVQEEREIVSVVKQHIQNGGKVSTDMQRYISSCEDIFSVPGRDHVAQQASHPVRAYLLIKRLSNISSAEVSMLTGKDVQLPTAEDLYMTALALIMLQDVYSLDMRSLVQGQIVMVSQSTNGEDPEMTEICSKDPAFRLELSDTYYIGDVACKENKFYHAVLWFNLTLEIMREKKQSVTNQAGLRMSKVLLKLVDTVQKIKFDRALFMAVSKLGATAQKTDANVEGLTLISNLLENAASSLRRPIRTEIPQVKYEHLCRLGVLKKQAPHSTLACRYVRSSPYFYLSPVKMEPLHQGSPTVTLYHDVITDKEADLMRDMALNRMNRSPVLADEGGNVFSKTRVSETGWIFDSEHPIIAKLSRRVGYITGLEVSWPYGEAFQVLNYGLGGFYEPHVDYFRAEQPAVMANGQRIVTFLFYLSDVEAGGATVFPRLNLAVPAVKNIAVMFHDLKKSLDFEEDSQHAGCPVLMGSKWIANKWIHAHGNEFRWPCGLTPEE
ncbi:prolyl 4-hydroxylase subunit alpha-3-like [Branchiostoma floridae x Branchiostoma belcheri]